MKIRTRSKYVHWLPGILVALLGVGIARLLSPALPEAYQSAAFIIGTCIAIAGIFITAAASTRSKRNAKVDEQK